VHIIENKKSAEDLIIESIEEKLQEREDSLRERELKFKTELKKSLED
jgi:hypothetical protein